MRRTPPAVFAMVLLILLLLPAMVVAPAHVAAHPDHADHCVFCLLYHAIETTVTVAALLIACRLVAVTFPLPRARALRSAPLSHASGRSPPVL